MERLKRFLRKRLETVVVVAIILSILVAHFFIDRKTSFLNIYYLPVLFAGYFLGKRFAVGTAVFSVLVVVILALMAPGAFNIDKEPLYPVLDLVSWGAFLLLTAAVVGVLFDAKQEQVEQLRAAYVGIVETLTKYIESSDRFTQGHSVRVSHLAGDIAFAMGLPGREVDNIRTAALLHDIGKVEVSGDVIRKAAELTTEEKEAVASDADKGTEILQAVGAVLKEAVPLILHHHRYYQSDERLEDDSGQTAPSLGASIIAVADAFDAIVTDRPDRKGRPPWQAYEQINNLTPRQFDPRAVEGLRLVMVAIHPDKDMQV